MNCGKIGWRELRLKYVFRSNPTKKAVRGQPDDLPVSFVPMDAVGEYGGLDVSREKTLAEVLNGYTYFRDGDVVVAKITPCFENGKGAIAKNLQSGIGFGTTELHVLRPRAGVDARFLFYLTISDRFRKLGEASMYGAGGQKRISEEFVEEYRAAIPPVEGQRTIASFLDRETARIDNLIEKKRRLLDLLEEKRTALITRAVTQGLDPSVTTKDSGAEWLGVIPAHWNNIKLGHVCRTAIAGPFGSSLTKSMYGGSTYRVYGQQQVIPNDFSRGGYYIPDDAFRALKRFETKPGDVLISCMGTVGNAAVVPPDAEPGIINPRLVRLRVRESSILPDFVPLAMRSMPVRYQVESLSRGGTMGGLNLSIVFQIRLPLPPIPEQRAILSFVRQQESSLDRLQQRIYKAIDLLNEYRASLISGVVTGTVEINDAGHARRVEVASR